VWGEECAAYDCGDEAARWLSHVLQIDEDKDTDKDKDKDKDKAKAKDKEAQPLM